MDVQCERCKTEYEFDDALVSGRGTTVKCTNCGHQFKIRPSVAATETERWTVQTVDGRRLVFTTLRELQKAITQHQVGRADTLSRGAAPPRALGSIAELEPFFVETDAGLAFPRAPSQADFGNVSPLSATIAAPSAQAPAVRQEQSRAPSNDYPPVRDRSNTLRPPPDMGTAVPPPAPPSRLAPGNSAPPSMGAEGRGGTVRVDPPLQPAPVHPRYDAPAQPLASSPLPPPTVPRRVQPSYDDIDVREPVRAPSPSMSDYADPDYAVVPRRRRVGGWVVAFVVLSGAGVIGYYAVRPYLGGLTRGSTSAAPATLEPRAQQYLADGERALSEGNLDTAKENFDKASALAERDPRVLLDLARLSAVRADIPWLRLRLLPAEAADDIAATKQSVSEMGALARKNAADALAVAPDDTAAVRAMVDALRIVGDREAARALVAKIIATASQAETAYVLAALDLSELDPLWPTVTDRLRVASAGEANLGRARAALVYALFRAGDVQGAKLELDKLAVLPRPHPLLASLRAFVNRTPAKPAADAGAPSARPVAAVVDVNSLPRESSGGGAGVAGDPRVLLEQAEKAKGRGDYDRAKMLYESALAKGPGDSQALSGLGDVARAQHDGGSAKGFYQRALASNPNFLPALVGLADVEWDEGDHARAQKAYKDVVDRFPEGTYPSRAKDRAAESAGGGGGSPSPAPTPASTPSTPPTGGSNQLTVPANTPSDLPGTPP